MRSHIVDRGGGLVAAIASGRPGRAPAGLTWSSPQSDFGALLSWPGPGGGADGSGPKTIILVSIPIPNSILRAKGNSSKARRGRKGREEPWPTIQTERVR